MWRHALRVVVVLLVLIIVGTAALGWRLAQGPLFLPFLASRFEAIITKELPPGGLARIGLIGVELADDLNPDIVLRDITVERPNDLRVSVNEVRVSARWSSLTQGRLNVDGVQVDRLLLSDIGPVTKLPPFDDIVNGIRHAIAENGLRFMEVASFGFGIERPGTERRDVLSGISLTASVADGKTLAMQAIGLGYSGAISLRLSADLPPLSEPIVLHGESRGFDLADIGTAIGRDDLGLNGSIGVVGSITVAPDAGVTAAGWQVVLGSTLRFGDVSTDALVGPVRLDFGWDADKRAVTFNPSPIVLKTGHLLAYGELAPPSASNPLWTYDFKLDGQDLLSGMRTSDGRIAGSYDPAASLFVVDDVHLEGAGISFTAAARASHKDGSAFAILSGVSPQLPLAALKALWPNTLAPEVRDWVGTYIQAGVITNATVDLALSGAAPAGDLLTQAAIAFDFSDADFVPFDGAPLIRDAVGHGKLAGDRFEIVVDSGWADLGDGRRLDLARSSFAVPKVSAKVPDGEVSIATSGTAAAGIALWNGLPLSDDAGFVADPEGAAGKVTAAVEIKLPLAPVILPKDIHYGGRIDLTGFDPGAPVAGRSVTKANLGIELNDDVANVRGKAMIDGSPADIFLTLPISGEGESKSVVKLNLDAAALKGYGVDVGDMLGGTIAVEMTEAGTTRKVSANVTKADINLAIVGYRKPAGKAGTLTFDLVTKPTGTSISSLSFKSGGAQVEGQVNIDADGHFQSATLPKFNFDSGDRLSLKASSGDGGLKVSVSGSQLDARSLVRNLLRQSTNSGLPSALSLDLSAALSNVQGEGGEQLDGLNLSAKIAGGQVARMSLIAQTSGGGSASATLSPGKTGRDLKVEAGEVGRLLRFLGVYSRVYGGRATLSGVLDDRGILAANLDGSRWKVVEEPALAQLSTASTTGPTEGLSTADIRRLTFDLHFGNGMLSIGEGFIRTETAGLTMSGDVDFAKNALRLAGSYLPANQVDSLLASIPLLGQTVFAGGGRSGLFGLSYRLSGPIDAPSLTINPLSAIAPGIFRRLFEMK